MKNKEKNMAIAAEWKGKYDNEEEEDEAKAAEENEEETED